MQSYSNQILNLNMDNILIIIIIIILLLETFWITPYFLLFFVIRNFAVILSLH